MDEEDIEVYFEPELVYENQLFTVETVELLDPVLNEETVMYGIYNKKTQVREAECRREFTAKALADGFQDQHQHPEAYIVVAPQDGNWGPGSGTEIH